MAVQYVSKALGISIHAPHTRSDFPHDVPCGRYQRFQSTPLIRGATAKSDKFCESLEYFNPRPSYEERRVIISQV